MKLPAVMGMTSEKISEVKLPREVSKVAVGFGMERSFQAARAAIAGAGPVGFSG